MSKNTSELWSVVPGYYPGFVEIFGASFKISVVTHAADIGLVESMNRIEDARRIVACVNACRGLPTEELEQKGLVAAVGTQLLAADCRAEGQEREIRRLARIAVDEENQLADSLNQRDELLEALEGLLADMHLRAKLDGDVDSDGCVVLNCGSSVLRAAHSAIAKANGV